MAVRVALGVCGVYGARACLVMVTFDVHSDAGRCPVREENGKAGRDRRQEIVRELPWRKDGHTTMKQKMERRRERKRHKRRRDSMQKPEV